MENSNPSALLNKAFTLPQITGEFVIVEKFKSHVLEKCGHYYGTVHPEGKDKLRVRYMYFGKLIEHEIHKSEMKFKKAS